LVFEVGEHRLAVEARRVLEVLEPLDATPIPGADPYVEGLVNLRGTLAVMANLAGLLDIGGEARPAEPALVVLERDSQRLALRVDRVVGVLPYPAAALEIDSDVLEALGARELISGVGEMEGQPFVQLDLDAIFRRVLFQPGDHDRSPQTASRGG
jgi:chemotaxis signal transduction protein